MCFESRFNKVNRCLDRIVAIYTVLMCKSCRGERCRRRHKSEHGRLLFTDVEVICDGRDQHFLPYFTVLGYVRLNRLRDVWLRKQQIDDAFFDTLVVVHGDVYPQNCIQGVSAI